MQKREQMTVVVRNFNTNDAIHPFYRVNAVVPDGRITSKEDRQPLLTAYYFVERLLLESSRTL